MPANKLKKQITIRIDEETIDYLKVMHGSCLCGQIKFEIDGPIPGLYQCHCTLCRKQSGSSSNTAMAVATNQVRWTSGTSLITSYVKPTGFRSDFCSVCGSPVPNQMGSSPYTWIPAGLLTSTKNLQISAHLFVASKASWEPQPTQGNVFHELPPLAELADYLYQHTN